MGMKTKFYTLDLQIPASRAEGLTPLGGMDDHHSAEGPVALVVVHPDLHFEGGEWRERLVPVFVHGGVGRGHHLLLPASGPVGAERHDVAEALAVLELLGHRLATAEREVRCGGGGRRLRINSPQRDDEPGDQGRRIVNRRKQAFPHVWKIPLDQLHFINNWP